MCRLICVDPARVAEFWPRVRELIRAAMRRGDLSSFADVEAGVLAGDALLWLAWSAGPNGGDDRHVGAGFKPAPTGPEIEAAAVTELQQTEWRKVCVIVACGGRALRRWLPLLDRIEAYARAERCSAVRIIGRKGWIRILTAYRPRRVVLEKELH
jgi:hypothetical protein